jgi:hypothetical protein
VLIGFQQKGKHCTLRSITYEVYLERRIASPMESQFSYLFTGRMIKLTVVIVEAHHCCQLHTKLYPTFFSLG